MKTDHQKIVDLITPTIEAMGYIVWHVELHKVSHKTLLRIYVDMPFDDERGNISIDDCSRISNQIGAVLAVEEPILGSYILEVSSPGLNRSLFKLEHYKRYIGRVIQIVLHHPVDGQHNFTGKVQEAFGNTLKLMVDNKVIDFEITNISKAKLISSS